MFVHKYLEVGELLSSKVRFMKGAGFSSLSEERRPRLGRCPGFTPSGASSVHGNHRASGMSQLEKINLHM